MENKEPHDIAEARIEIMNISKLGQNSRRALIDVTVNAEHNSMSRGWRNQSADDKIRVSYTAKPKAKRGAKGQTGVENNNDDRPDETELEQKAREKLERELVRTDIDNSEYCLLWQRHYFFVDQN